MAFMPELIIVDNFNGFYHILCIYYLLNTYKKNFIWYILITPLIIMKVLLMLLYLTLIKIIIHLISRCSMNMLGSMNDSNILRYFW